MTKATIGEISSGTLATDDLLHACAFELTRLAETDEDAAIAHAAGQMVLAYCRDETVNDASAVNLLESLMDRLDELAPAYTYFGVSPADGSDFGFWPDMSAVEELPHVSDPNEVEAMGEDCVFVNDHGNVTVYGGDGAVIWDCV